MCRIEKVIPAQLRRMFHRRLSLLMCFVVAQLERSTWAIFASTSGISVDRRSYSCSGIRCVWRRQIFFFRISSFHIVTVEFCSRGLASGPTSKRLASDGGLLVVVTKASIIFSSDTCWSNHNAVSLNATCGHRREGPGTRSDYLCLQNKCCVMKLINNSCL